MAELSQETKAIIDRLKAEGDLIRNSGTNSIKAVQINLGKFENLFSSIEANIVEQTKILQMQAGMAQEAVEAQRTKEQYDEIVPPVAKQSEDTSNDTKSDTNAKINSMGDKIEKALSLRNIALGAAGLFVGYNLLKGFIDDQTGGGFTEMQNTIRNIRWSDVRDNFNNAVSGLNVVDWAAVGPAINAMTTAVSGINWTNFTNAVNSMSETVTAFTTWLGETGVDDIVSTVIAGGMVTAGARGLGQGLWRGATGGGGRGRAGGIAGRLGRIGPNIALAAAGLALYYGNDIKNWLNEQMGTEAGGTGESIVNQSVDIATAGLGLISIAGMFGPPGLIALAAVTGTVLIGNAIRHWVNDYQEKARNDFNTQVDAAIAAAEAEDPTNLSDDTATAVATAMAEARRRTQLAIGQAAVEEAEQAEAELRQILAQQNVGDGSEGVTQDQLSRLRTQALAGDSAAIQELLTYAEGRESDRGYLSRTFGGTRDEWIADFIRSIGDTAYGDQNLSIEEQIRQADAWDAMATRILNGDFSAQQYGGRGLVVERPGERLAYMRQQEANQLDALIIAQQNAQQRDAQIDTLMAATEAYLASVNGAPVVISAPTTVSPTINNIDGGRSVNHLSVMQGGGGAGLMMSVNPYGLPAFAN